MTPEQVANMLKALENEYKAGNLTVWNFKAHHVIERVFELAYQVAEEHAELTKRVEVLEAKPTKGE
jgi:hypothetical protein